MKKIALCLLTALALGVAPVQAKHHPGKGPKVEHRHQKHKGHGKPAHHPAPPPPRHARPHHPAPPPPPPPRYYARPAGVSVSLGPLQLVMTSGGRYYREVYPGRYAIQQPPLGLVVPHIPNGRRVMHGGYPCRLVQGVVYLPLGNGFKVVGYM